MGFDGEKMLGCLMPLLKKVPMRLLQSERGG